MSRPVKTLADVSLKEGLIIGILFAGAGIYIELLSFGILPSAGMNAPPVLGALAGAIFLMPGLLSTYYAIRNHIRIRKNITIQSEFDTAGWLVSALILTLFAVIGFWVSFAGSSEAFSGGVTGTVVEFRVGFGVGAALCLGGAALVWRHGIRKLFGKRSIPPQAQ